jgi:dTDP-4-amino-4,6-dideoxygalactose transaminase
MIPLFKVFVAPESLETVGKTLSSGYLAQGPQVDAFEAQLGKHFANPRMVTVNSCTSAIHLALHLIKREYGLADDTQVIATPITCAASNFPVLANRMKLLWADVCAETLNIDLDDVERKLRRDTRILLFVHWGGYPIDYARVAELKTVYRRRFSQDLIVIEDCAHAWESRYQGQFVGNVQPRNFACFSFQAIKALTCGDGGLLIAPENDSAATDGRRNFYRQARLARWFGLDRDNKLDFRSAQDIEQWGFKFHLNDLAASLGLANYPHIRALVERHKANARWYYEQLENIPGLTLLERRADCDSSYWLFTIRVANRAGFMQALQSRGVSVNPVHTRNDKYTALAEFQSPLPTTDRVAEEMISIPVGWWVTDADREQIVKAIRAGW